MRWKTHARIPTTRAPQEQAERQAERVIGL